MWRCRKRSQKKTRRRHLHSRLSAPRSDHIATFSQDKNFQVAQPEGTRIEEISSGKGKVDVCTGVGVKICERTEECSAVIQPSPMISEAEQSHYRFGEPRSLLSQRSHLLALNTGELDCMAYRGNNQLRFCHDA